MKTKTKAAFGETKFRFIAIALIACALAGFIWQGIELRGMQDLVGIIVMSLLQTIPLLSVILICDDNKNANVIAVVMFIMAALHAYTALGLNGISLIYYIVWTIFNIAVGVMCLAKFDEKAMKTICVILGVVTIGLSVASSGEFSFAMAMPLIINVAVIFMILDIKLVTYNTREKFNIKRNVIKFVLLGFATCFIYWFYWVYVEISSIKRLTNDKYQSPIFDTLCFTFIPLYSIYWAFTMDRKLMEQSTKYGLKIKDNRYLFAMFAALFLWVVPLAFM